MSRSGSVSITYDREAEPAIEVVELPLVIGVLADLSGQPEPTPPPLEDRKFIDLYPGNFDAVLAACEPRLTFAVSNHLSPESSLLEVGLRFRRLSDFEPEAVARQVPGLLEACVIQRPEASRQLNDILHAPEFQRLEASWRGLRYLLSGVQISASIKVRVLNVSKAELLEDFRSAPSPERSALFRRVYEEPFGTFGADPFTILIGDFEFSNEDDDLELLEGIAAVAAAAHAPCLAAASPKMFGVESYPALSGARRLGKLLQQPYHARWRSFRESENAGYAALFLPRILLRVPYGDESAPVEAFSYDESVDHLLWGASAYAMGIRIAESFRAHRWFAAIQGPESGGRVVGLPMVTVRDSAGSAVTHGPVEILVDDVLEHEIALAGFNCLLQWKGVNRAAFFTATTCRKPREYLEEEATRFDALAVRIPYVLAAARFAHYTQAMLRDKIGAFRSSEDCERALNAWIQQYVLEGDSATAEDLARLPLRDARIEVGRSPDKPGRYRATVFVRPHFQLPDPGFAIRVTIEMPAGVLE